MSLLTIKDYQNIVNFYIFINEKYSDFINRTLIALDTFFDIKLTAYTIFDVNSNGERSISDIKSLYLRPHLLTHYQENYFHYDTFFNEIDKLRNSNKTNYSYTNNDLCYEDFSNSPYGKFLRSNNLAYQTILDGSEGAHPPIHIISIFKTINEGNFTLKEQELLTEIGRTYYHSMNLYRKHIEQENKLSLTNHLTKLISLGFVILNRNKSIINLNETFRIYGSFLSNKSNINEIVCDLINLVESTNQISIDKLIEYSSVKKHNFLITIYPPQLHQIKNIEIYYYLTISKIEPRQQTDNIQNRLSKGFNLTPRENEIAALLVNSLSNTQISDTLFISVSTVKTHIRNIFNKLDVSTRSEAIQEIRKLIS